MTSYKTLFSAAMLAVACQALNYPGDSCCDLYADKNFNGQRVHACLGDALSPTPTPAPAGMTIKYLPDFDFHDKMSSYWCGKNVYWFMCTGTSGDCDGHHGLSGGGNTRNRQMSYGDDVDRVFLQHYDADRS